MTKQAININNIIFSQIESRYDLVRGASQNTGNNLLDSYYPFYLYQKLKNDKNINMDKQIFSKSYSISELISKEFGSKKIYIGDLIKIFNYNTSQITKILKKLKSKRFSMVLLGAGGTGSNFLYWTSQLCELTNINEIFNTIVVIDYDKFDIVNMLRIPFIPNIDENESTYKVDCIPNNIKIISSTFTTSYTKIDRQEDLDWIINNKISNSFAKRELCIYGAPDIQTRNLLNNYPKKFFAATHQDDRFSIIENPIVDENFIIETYGKINLSKFFINQLYMTIEFLKYLSEQNTIAYSDDRVENNIIYEDSYDEIVYRTRNGKLKMGSKQLNDNYFIQHNIELEDVILTEDDIVLLNER